MTGLNSAARAWRVSILVCCAICLLATAFLSAPASSAPRASVVPEGGFMPGWKVSGPTLRFGHNNLFDYIDGGAELFLEFGFKQLLVQRYARDSSEITLELYRMESPEAALGIYLARSDEETPVSGIAARNSGSPYQLTILKGSSFIQINNFEGGPESLPAMATLAKRALSSIPDARPVRLFDNLPKEGLVPGSEMLVRGQFGLQPIFTLGKGDILQLGGKVFAVVGDYHEAGSTYTRIIALYPGRGAARRAFDNLVANLDSYLEVLRKGANDTGAGFVFKDYQGKFGSVELRGSNIVIRINLSEQP